MSLERTLEPEVMDSSQEALSYDAMDHSDVNRCFVDDFLGFPGNSMLTAQDTIIDLGTGTAQIPVELIQRLTDTPSVVACDLSLEMLRVARKNIVSAGRQGVIIPVYANARRLPISDSSCRFVISNSIIHHIPHPESVFQEVHRIAAPGAVIFFRDLLRPTTSREVEELVQQWASTADYHQQQMFRDSLHAALTISEVRKLLAGVGFSSTWVSQTTDRHWTIAGRTLAD
jgi:ubiquinone/menaquinone biosynthesis C-methylase UbiE